MNKKVTVKMAQHKMKIMTKEREHRKSAQIHNHNKQYGSTTTNINTTELSKTDDTEISVEIYVL